MRSFLLTIALALSACTFQSPPVLQPDAAVALDAGVVDADICEMVDAPFLLASFSN